MPPKDSPYRANRSVWAASLRRIRTRGRHVCRAGGGSWGVDRRGSPHGVRAPRNQCRTTAHAGLPTATAPTRSTNRRACPRWRSRADGMVERYPGQPASGLLDIFRNGGGAVRLRGAKTTCTFLSAPDLRAGYGHLSAPRFRLCPNIGPRSGSPCGSGAKRVITGEEPVPYVAVVHEERSGWQFGGREVARAQLDYLLEVSEAGQRTLWPPLGFSALRPWRVPRSGGRPSVYARDPYPSSIQCRWTAPTDLPSFMPRRSSRNTGLQLEPVGKSWP